MSEEKNQSNQPSSQSTANPDDEKIIAAIGYFWLLFLLPLLLKKDSQYCQFHAKQGLVLFIFSLIIMIIGVIPVLGWLIAFLGWIIVVILALLGFVNALQGRKWELPYLGKYARRINL